MISRKIQKLLNNNKIVKEMFEEGRRLKEIYGKENVYDFSLGNPTLPTPKIVDESIIEVLNTEDSSFIHGYSSNGGYKDVKDSIARNINNKYNTNLKGKNIIMTVGAASALNVILKTILDKDDEVIIFTPYFGDYDNYIENYDGKVVKVKSCEDTFLPNIELFEKSITNNTKAVIINTPNNPTGVVYDDITIKSISNILNKKEEEYNHDIYLISDEPYREIVYDNINVPYITNYYNNTFIVYSFSKCLSLAGERIGYIVVSNNMNDEDNMIDAIIISNRIIGSVNAPTLIQRAIIKCLDEKVDINYYKKNRDKLLSIMDKYNLKYIKPEGTFYLFVKTPIDDTKFCTIAKKYNLLFTPSSLYGIKGYIRIAYCVDYNTIVNSEKAFELLFKEINNI